MATAPSALILTDLLSVEGVKVPLEGGTKEAVIRELVDVLAGLVGVHDREPVLRGVLEREAVLSTGIGNGVAIPHCKSAAVPELTLAAGRTAEPVAFDALDGKPVNLVFLLVGPESGAGAHVKALSRISRIVRREDVRRRLVAATDAAGFYSALKEAESL